MGRDRGRGKRGRVQGKEFMDAALDAYIRFTALRQWRRYEAARAAQPAQPEAQILEQVGRFPDRGLYAEVWQRQWSGTLAQPSDQPLFGRIEAAVRQAVLEERAARQQRGEPAFEDLPDYNEFINHALGQLMADAGGEHEQF